MTDRLSFKEIDEISLDDLMRRDLKIMRTGLVKNSPLLKKRTEAGKRLEYLISLDGKSKAKSSIKMIEVKCKACGMGIKCPQRSSGGIDLWNLHRHYAETCSEGPRTKPLKKGPAKCSECGYKDNRGRVYAHRYKRQH